jgi:DNA replication licensing factor MCM5
MDIPEHRRERVYEIALGPEDGTPSDECLKDLFVSFVETFRLGPDFLYRSQIMPGTPGHLRILVEHMSLFDDRLLQAVLARPVHYIELFTAAINKSRSANLGSAKGTPSIQVEFLSRSTFTTIRRLDSAQMNKIVTIRGIVLTASAVISRPSALFVFCKTCLHSSVVKEVIPRRCDSCSGVETYIAVPEKSPVQDVQIVKMQELFSDVPPGDTPRHVATSVERGMVDRLCPGMSAIVTGVYMVGGAHGQSPFVRALGISLGGQGERVEELFEDEAKESIEEEGVREIFAAFRRKGLQRELIVKSIAPGIFGHSDIKLALACALFGGVGRVFADGVAVRGDVNVLLLGDPGIAKSQMLKFLATASGRGVYTSGKGASAAGLTASVCRDRSGGFYLEGGALVLADGGLCCIDEFDKMQDKDRVAIHEAMEQQTISISKAGIVTVLNARCAVVAAANPVFGRYDDNRTPGENIKFGGTIMSRFDLIFVLKDRLDGDKAIASHILSRNVPSNRGGESEHVPVKVLRKYVEFARKISPKISEEAAERLKSFYIQTRRSSREAGSNGIPITVRQLEAIARIGEALARMDLESVVGIDHLEEAIRLFNESTMKAVSMGHYVEGMPRSEWTKEFSGVESSIKKVLPIGTTRPYKAVVSELAKMYSEVVVVKCIEGLVKSEKLSLRSGGKVLIRLP